MASVALIEAYPYATIRGGDGVYLDLIRRHLLACGHDVTSIVTDAARGRTSPIVRLHGEPMEGHRRRMRSALRLGGHVYLSFQPRMLWHAFLRLLGRKPGKSGDPTTSERRWLARQLGSLQPDVVILAFGACAFTKMLADQGLSVAALRGFFEEIENRLAGDGREQQAMLSARYDELAAADFVAFNNKADVRSYVDFTGRPASLVGMGFMRRAEAPPGTTPTVIFVGAATACNVESLRWFLDRCWGQVLKHVPDAQFRIVGSIAKEVEAAQHPNVTAVGMVDDLAPEYAAAQVVVAPLVLGSNGVKTKVAEALSFGRPLVTTSLGIEPEQRDRLGDGVLIADEPERFATCIVRLLTEPDLRSRHERGASAIFERLFSPEVAHASLRDFIRRGHGVSRELTPT